jgi:transposase
MSTSLLYHGWGIRGYCYGGSRYRQGTTEFMIEQHPDTWRCSHCGSGDVTGAGQVERRFRDLPIGSRPTWIVLPVPRLCCRRCGKTRQATVAFADERVHYTRGFERYVVELSRRTTIQDAAMHLGVSWDTVKDIQKRYLQRRFKHIRLRHVQRIAIDEISIGKGHRYLTIVLDLDSGAVVYIGEGKGADSLEDFWKKLKAARAKIRAVATDLSPAYILAVSENIPKAVHVFDRFHVVKLFNDKLSQLRRQIQNTAETVEQKQVLKGTRWLLLKNPQNLDPKRNEQQRLDDALRLNRPLFIAYQLKEDLRQLWEQANKPAAGAFLDDWIARARLSGIPMLNTMANTLQLHRKGLLAWYDCPISTGPLEGTNNKIKTMQRQAYGFRDPEFRRLKIFAIHETTYALVG